MLTIEENVYILPIGAEFVARTALIFADVVHGQRLDDQVRRVFTDLDLSIAVLDQFGIVEVPLEAHRLLTADQSAIQTYRLVLCQISGHEDLLNDHLPTVRLGR